MKTAFEKNRYLRLDGSRMEHGEIKRTLAPGILTASFLISSACLIDLDNIKGIKNLIYPIGYTAAGLVIRRGLRLATNTLWYLDFHKYAVDTRPTAHTKHNPPDYYDARAALTTALTSAAVTASLITGMQDENFTPLESFQLTWRADLPLLFPTFASAIEQGQTFYNVKTGKWKIVKKTDMEQQSKATSPTLTVLTPASTPT